ncbi:LysR family transcriptional regulator [Cupriavidus basilensis OR16]|uniref:LysR family transcriptional regulator n=1 Tax=Cupriavidus basilensis OR16 TaxID=1127483 RepID=H1SFJ9_9BURK|nr:LysR family transcriptional regulator [Cupriavidus basilensis]EHP38704.1 LysR family transcriptional regulator [Cupriavidus basilensis OR16]
MLNRLEMLRIFCAAAESASFKAAATRLGTSPQTVTRAVKDLEEAVGEPLFHRNTRQIRITAAGERLAERARAALVDVDSLFAHPASRSDTELKGVVRITAPSTLGRQHLLVALREVALAHPGITLDIRLSDQVADVVDDEIDIGLRLGMFRDQRLVARMTTRVGFHVVGTPELAARVGKPGDLAQLAALPTTGLIDRSSGRAWPWYFAQGEQFNPRAPAFLTDDPETEMEAILCGLAYGQLPDYLAQPHLRSGRLVSVLDRFAPTPWGLYIYRSRRSPVPIRIRLVFDALVAYFGGKDAVPAR